ncbi:MAG: hypothetical protein P4L98_16155, partial [Ancalomicrobiaceae bacterium]|nr:hypothetical protein [Ancalomicrobiaceae bacterium]
IGEQSDLQIDAVRRRRTQMPADSTNCIYHKKSAGRRRRFQDVDIEFLPAKPALRLDSAPFARFAVVGPMRRPREHSP